MQAVLMPEGIQFVKPSIGFHPIYTKKDRIRWAHLYLHLQGTGVAKAKAEAAAFLEVWKMRDYALKYS
jgi:hypothetical protein